MNSCQTTPFLFVSRFVSPHRSNDFLLVRESKVNNSKKGKNLTLDIDCANFQLYLCGNIFTDIHSALRSLEIFLKIFVKNPYINHIRYKSSISLNFDSTF